MFQVLTGFFVFLFRKMERLRALLADRDFFKGGTFLDFEPLPFLLDPELLIKGVVAEKCVLYFTIFTAQSL